MRLVTRRLFIALLLTVAPLFAQLDSNEGFCANGTPAGVAIPKDVPPQAKFWGSYCPGPLHRQVGARTAIFIAPEFLQLYIAGYPSIPLNDPKIHLWLENVMDGSRVAIAPNKLPMKRWSFCEFAVPESWRGKPVRLIAEDGRLNSVWWLGFSEPLKVAPVAGWGETAAILLHSLEHFFLLMLPAAALCAFAVKKGLRDPIIAGAIGLAAIGIPGYLVFWLTLFSPYMGHRLAFSIAIGSLILLIIALRRLDLAGRRIPGRTDRSFLTGGSAVCLCAPRGICLRRARRAFRHCRKSFCARAATG